jgi:hypothetical protein
MGAIENIFVQYLKHALEGKASPSIKRTVGGTEHFKVSAYKCPCTVGLETRQERLGGRYKDSWPSTTTNLLKGRRCDRPTSDTEGETSDTIAE